jgi:hypothetical protein
LVVVAAIYATLGPARVLAAFLRERDLLRVSMAGVMLLAGGLVTRRAS